jgi:hypothetical protein
MTRVSSLQESKLQAKGPGFYSDCIVQRLGDRRITLYRRTDIQDSCWFFCVYLREEKRQYRISLKTTDRHEAKRKAENVLIELLSKIRNGEKILSYSIAEVLRFCRSEQERLVQENPIAAKTVLLQSYRIKLGMEWRSWKENTAMLFNGDGLP